MTATWNLESADKELLVTMGFHHGWPNKMTFGVKSHSTLKKFNNPFSADKYAISLGVKHWRFVARNRATPLAAILPILFDDAPPGETLDELVTAFEQGATLRQLAKSLAEGGWTNVTPMTLRIAQRYRHKRLQAASPDTAV